MTRWAIVACVLAGCTADVNDVGLVFPPNGAIGFQCVDAATGEPLLESGRVVDGVVTVSVVVDYLRFDGVPSCRATQLLGWCRERGCPAVARDCRALQIPADEITNDLSAIQDRIVAEVRGGGPITEVAPDGVVLVRLVLTNQACDTVGAGADPPALACEDLLGCVYSCPVQLDEVEGPVLLELDTLGETCGRVDVSVCARIGHGVDATCG